MKPFSLSRTIATWMGVALTVPTLSFLLISVLKYGFGWGYLFDNATPALEGIGLKESIGWNSNLFFLFGPVLALFLNVLSVLPIHFEISKEMINCQVSISKKWNNLAVICLSGTTLFILFAYLFAENCNGL